MPRKALRIAGLCLFMLSDWSAFPMAAHAVPSCHPRSFADYPAGSGNVQHPVAAQPLLTSKKAQQFRTAIRREFSEPANFAGHYRVAIWGCGADCRDFAILDKETGSVYDMPGESEVVGIMGNNDERIDFRAGSKLFIISGCFNESESCLNKPEKLFYEWTGKTLQLIGRCPLEVEEVD